ncbi:MAG TPA: SDR family oxidoreductase [Candidatus Acidoferrales bacterium]|nr:SDR family oxidoreductase [Candidatus Acidoferrales bacterium]
MNHWQDKWALITGASAGIGMAMARELAAGGTNLILTARRRDRLTGLAGELNAKHDIRTLVCVADLGQPLGPQQIFAFTEEKNIAVDLLVNNAGFGAYGEFHQVRLDRLIEMTQVNVTAVVQMTHLFLAGMIARRSGDILIVASTAAFQAVPYISTYAATKVFDLHFAEGLAEEVRQYGVRVCALCPGSTETEFFQVAGQRNHTRQTPESAEKVARVGLAALAAGKSSVISGFTNWLGAETVRFAPRRAVARIAGGIFRPPKT